METTRLKTPPTNPDGGMVNDRLKDRGCFLSREWTLGYLFQKYRLTKIPGQHFLGEALNSKKDSTLRDALEELLRCGRIDAYMAELIATSLNNIVGSLYNADAVPGDSEWLHFSGPAPVDYWSEAPIPVELTEDRTGIVRKSGLGIAHYVACNDTFYAYYEAGTGGINAWGCHNWKSAPLSSQKLFGNKSVKFGADSAPHAFQETTLWPFGFENTWGARNEHRSALILEGRSLSLTLKTEGDSWVALDWNARRQQDGILWRVKGYDTQTDAFIVYVSYVANHAADNSFFYPPYSDAFTKEEIAAYTHDKVPMESAIDRFQSGNLFLAISGNNGVCPQIGEDGIWRWSNRGQMQFQISAGTTLAEAITELQRVRTSGSPTVRCQERYRRVASGAPSVQMPGHRNIEAIVAHAPLGLEGLKLEGDYMLRYGANASFMDPHTSFLSMRSLLYSADYTHVDNFLGFLADPVRRGPDGQMPEMLAFDGLPDHFFLKWSFQDMSWLGLVGHLLWHSRDRQVMKHYATGCEHLLRILEDIDADTSLFCTYGKWPDMQIEEAGRKGRPWVAWESGLWYEALRNWELLTARQGDHEISERIGRTARKLHASFQKLFYDEVVGFICDSVDPETKSQHPHYPSFHLNFLCGFFAHELFDGASLCRMAETAYRGLYDTTWKTFRITLRVGAFHSNLESKDVSWAFAGLAKLFRLARHRQGLRAILECYEFHYGKMLHFLESFNMFPSMNGDENRREVGFDCGISSRHQAILEGFFGVHLAPDNVGIFPLGLGEEGAIRLNNLPVGKSRWNFTYTGSGSWPEQICLDGKDSPASWVFPSRMIDDGEHTVEVVFSEHLPRHPVLLEAGGLELVDAEIKGSTLVARLRGPGRAYVRFWSPSQPIVTRNGEPLEMTWNSSDRYALAEVSVPEGEEIELSAFLS